MTVREIFVALGLDADSAGFAAAQLMVSGIEGAAHLAVEAVEKLTEGFKEMIVGAAERAHHLETLSRQTGVSTQAIQELTVAASQSGLSQDELAHGLQFLARSAYSASKGSEETASAFGRLGISVRGADGQLKSAEELLGETADAFESLPEGIEKSGLAFKVFGRAGARLLPLFEEGAAGLEHFKQEAHALGLVMKDESIKEGAKFAKNLDLFSKLSSTAGIAGPIHKALNEIIGSATGGTGILGWIAANQALRKQRMKEIGEGIANALRLVAEWAGKLAKVAVLLVNNLRLVAVLMGATLLGVLIANAAAIATNVSWYIALGIQATIAALRAAAAWLAATWPLIALIALLAAIYLAWDDITTYFEGGDSLIGELGERWMKFLDQFAKPQAGDPWWMTMLRTAVGYIANLDTQLPAALQAVREAFASFFSWLIEKSLNIGGSLIKNLTMGLVDTSKYESAGGALAYRSIMDPGSLFGGGATPAATAQTSAGVAGAAGGGQKVLAPTFHAPITVNGAAGQAPGEVAGAVSEQLDDWWNKKMREGWTGA